MKVSKTVPYANLEHITRKDAISSILDEIFLICKQDKRFFKTDRINKIEDKIEEVENRIKKQNELTSESKKIEEDLDRKNKHLGNNIENKRIKLLESLGSEIWK